ncbi:MAG TPA: XRE family transcriptional regulator [Streptomyces sp.]|nr:XRE family transcriptional regulator [Streptomyces sp.]
MAEKNESSGTLRYFGSQLRLWRQKAGMSRERLAEEVGYSVDMIRSVEQGRRIPQPGIVEAMDDVLGAGGMLKAGTVFLSREKYPAYAADFVQYEAEAVTMYWYESQFIPGLLQTESHARALLRAHCPPLHDDTIEERVTARMERQALLTDRTNMVLSFVIDETALRRPVGGVAALKEQLLHLQAAAKMRHVSVQVLPLDRGAHAGLNGPMVLMETAGCQHFAYVEGQVTSLLISDPNEVSVLSRRYGILRSQALDTEESARFIQQAIGEL